MCGKRLGAQQVRAPPHVCFDQEEPDARFPAALFDRRPCKSAEAIADSQRRRRWVARSGCKTSVVSSKGAPDAGGLRMAWEGLLAWCLAEVGVANFMNNIPPKVRSQSLELKATGVPRPAARICERRRGGGAGSHRA